MEIIIHIQKKHSTNVQQHNTEINNNNNNNNNNLILILRNGNSEKNASPIKQILNNQLNFLNFHAHFKANFSTTRP